MTSASTCDISIPRLSSAFTTSGHVMPGFQENLAGVGTMSDADYTVTFTKHQVTIYSPTGTPIITVWRETDGPRCWCMSLLPNLEDVHSLSSAPDAHKTSLQYFSTYNLHIVEALVRYFHADSGLPV